jgi:hypothetical protein
MPTELSAVRSCNVIAFPVQGRALGQADHAFVQSAVADIAQAWSIELQGLCADDAALVVVPDDGDDAVGPSFVICQKGYGFRLVQTHWDVVTEVGVFASLHDVVKTLRLRLALYPQLAGPGAVTLH